MAARSQSYEVNLVWDLTHIEYAAAYLNAALREGTDVFLLALLDIAKSQGVSAVARRAGLNREMIYRALGPRGNPSFRTLNSVIRAMGFRFTVSLQKGEEQ